MKGQRRRDRQRQRERERESDNRVSTIKANPPATLIMVCRIDLSRSPEQSGVPTGHGRPTRSRFELISSRETSPRDGDIPRKVLHRGALWTFYGRDSVRAKGDVLPAASCQ